MIIGGNYTIDFAKVSNIPKFIVGVKAGDSKRKISLTLLENNIPINLNKYTVVVACKKSDGNDIFNSVVKTDAVNGKCEVEITNQMLTLDTDLPCEIVLYGSNNLVATSSNFIIGRISNLRDEKSITSSSEFSALTEALSNVSEVKTEIDVERKRIDAFTKLEDGSTTGDAELIDARIGADGKIYENLGSSIRSQIKSVKENIPVSKNIVSASYSDTINYSSTNNVLSYGHLYSTTCSPNLDGGYYVKKINVYGYNGATINLSLWKAERKYPNNENNKTMTFTKIRNLGSSIVSDNVATFELFEHIKQGTILMATSNGKHIAYGNYKDNAYSIFEYGSSKANDCKVGETYDNSYAATYTSKFDIEYVLEGDVILEEDDTSSIVQGMLDGRFYDNNINNTSLAPVQNKVLYNEFNIVETSIIEPTKLTYDQSITNDGYAASTIAVNAPTEAGHKVYSIDVHASTGSTVRFVLCSFVRFNNDPNGANYNRGYFTVEQELGTVVSELGHAVLNINNGLTIDDPNNQHILACTDGKYMGYKRDCIVPFGNGCKSLYIYNNFDLYNMSVGQQCSNLFSYTPIYEEGETTNTFGVYSIVYEELETKTVTTVTNVKEAVRKILKNNSSVGDTNIGSSFGSVLSGKKWACCGDSVTYGVDEVLEDGVRKTYEHFISTRNGMDLYKDGISGSTMTLHPSKEAISFSLNRYKAIPKDVDYITLWFGINDNTAISLGQTTLGTIDDTDITTFYGAYNTVMKYLITNIPKAKIGLVVSHMCGVCAEAIREIAKKYGVCVFDIPADPKIPFWCPGSSYYADTIDSEISAQRNSDYWVNPSHPNIQGYEFISYPFENWMKSL